MLQTETRVGTRHFAIEALVHAKCGVDADIAVGVRAELPACRMRLTSPSVKFVFSRDENAVVVWAAHVRLRESRCPLRDGAVANHLHKADAHPFIAQSGANAGLNHAINVFVEDGAVHAD